MSDENKGIGNSLSMATRLGIVALFVLTTYCMAWIHAYRQSSAYFEYAEAMREQGELVIALKGMNKLEMRIEDTYNGGYQQVVETWESSILGIRPAFYKTAQEEAQKVLPLISEEELLSFIDMYIQLDVRYVPEAAQELLKRSLQHNNAELQQAMEEFLVEAFPEYEFEDA